MKTEQPTSPPPNAARPRESYRDQLRDLVQQLAMPNREAGLRRRLEAGCDPPRVKMFVDGNLDKRLDKLSKELEFVADAFEEFESLAAAFIRAEPLRALSSSMDDAGRMLGWLEATQPLTPEQMDYVTCQRTRHLIEATARDHRAAYVDFQHLLAESETRAPRPGGAAAGRIRLNPTRRWARLSSGALLEGQADPPVNVLFFAVRGEIASAILELEGQALLNELADLEPCTLDEWSLVSRLADRDELVDFCHDLRQLGLAAFAA